MNYFKEYNTKLDHAELLYLSISALRSDFSFEEYPHSLVQMFTLSARAYVFLILFPLGLLTKKTASCLARSIP